jgi:hypothetical protein
VGAIFAVVAAAVGGILLRARASGAQEEDRIGGLAAAEGD